MGQQEGALSECYTYTVTHPTFLFCSVRNRPRRGERQALHPFLSRQIDLPPNLRRILPVPSMPTELYFAFRVFCEITVAPRTRTTPLALRSSNSIRSNFSNCSASDSRVKKLLSMTTRYRNHRSAPT